MPKKAGVFPCFQGRGFRHEKPQTIYSVTRSRCRHQPRELQQGRFFPEVTVIIDTGLDAQRDVGSALYGIDDQRVRARSGGIGDISPVHSGERDPRIDRPGVSADNGQCARHGATADRCGHR